MMELLIDMAKRSYLEILNGMSRKAFGRAIQRRDVQAT
jgi:hypothetical protein